MPVTLYNPSATNGVVFAQGSDGALYAIWQSPTGSWPGFMKLGGAYAVAGPPSASSVNGTIWAALRGNDGLLYATGISGPVSEVGATGQQPPEITTNPVTAGALAFALGTDGRLLTAKLLKPANEPYLWAWLTPPLKLAGSLGAGLNSNGLVELFATGVDGNLWHTWQVAGTNQWAPFYNHGKNFSGSTLSPGSPLVLTPDAYERLQLFGTGETAGATGQLVEFSQIPGMTWFGTGSLGSPSGVQVTDALAVTTTNGLMLVAFLDPASGVWVLQQNPNDWRNGPQYWAGWQNLGLPPGGETLVGKVTAAPGSTGNVEIFATSNTGNLWHIWQMNKNNSPWSPWFNHGQPA